MTPPPPLPPQPPTRPALPFVLLPGLLGSPRLYAGLLPPLWQYGPVSVADTTRHDGFPAMARRILHDAPPRFGLVGLSMGGYLAFEILRQAAERVQCLVLLDTSARPDAPESSAVRIEQIRLAGQGRLGDIVGAGYPRCVHPSRVADKVLRQEIRHMALSLGADVFIRQQRAIMARADSRPLLPAIACPTLVMVGDSDQIVPLEHAREIADAIPGASLAVIPQCGHVSTMEQPDAVNDILLPWLNATLTTGT